MPTPNAEYSVIEFYNFTGVVAEDINGGPIFRYADKELKALLDAHPEWRLVSTMPGKHKDYVNLVVEMR